MIKKSLTLLSLSLMLVSAFAQNGNFKPLSRNKKHRCYTVEIQDKFLTCKLLKRDDTTPVSFQTKIGGYFANSQK